MSQHQTLQPTNPLTSMVRNTTLQLANKKTTIIDKENITPSSTTVASLKSLKPSVKKEVPLKPSNKLSTTNNNGELKRKFNVPPSSDKSPKKKKFSIFEDQTLKINNNRMNLSSPNNSPTLLNETISNNLNNTITNTINTTSTTSNTNNLPKTIIEYEIIEEEAIIQPYLEKIKILEQEIVELTNDNTYYQLMYNAISNNDTKLTIDSLKHQITILENTKNVFRNKIISLSRENHNMKINFEYELNLQKQAEKHLRETMQQLHQEEVLKLQSEIDQLKKQIIQ